MKIKKYLKEIGFSRAKMDFMRELSRAAQEIYTVMDKNNGLYLQSDKAYKMLEQAKELIRKATNQAKKDVVG